MSTYAHAVVRARERAGAADEAKAALTESIQFVGGGSIPKVGLGVYQSEPGTETFEAVAAALRAGYRMIDTAAMYGNEESVGRAISSSGIPREELFVTTKLLPRDHGYLSAIAACEASLHRLGMSYVDLYVIHAPVGGKIVETWDALLELQRLGKARKVGVSNFGVEHLQTLKEHKRPLPPLNQVEMHPLVYHPRRALLRFHGEHNIVT